MAPHMLLKAKGTMEEGEEGEEGPATLPPFMTVGNCFNPKPFLMADFMVEHYQGLWFDIESVPNQYQHTKACVTQNYTWAGDMMTVATRGLNEEGKKVRQSALMRVEEEKIDEPHPAYMTVEATGVPEAPYQIIDTDYETYSCVYSCLEYYGFRAEFAWVFGRRPSIEASAVQKCHQTFRDMGVDPTKMLVIQQGKDCPYWEKIDMMLDESNAMVSRLLGKQLPKWTGEPEKKAAAPAAPAAP